MNEDVAKIENKILEKSDIGKEVWYIPDHARTDYVKWQKGVLSSFVNTCDGSSIFIRFHGCTGERVSSKNLKWVKK